MNHQLENAVPHQAVVQGGGTTPPLKPRPGLWEEKQGVNQTSLLPWMEMFGDVYYKQKKCVLPTTVSYKAHMLILTWLVSTLLEPFLIQAVWNNPLLHKTSKRNLQPSKNYHKMPRLLKNNSHGLRQTFTVHVACSLSQNNPRQGQSCSWSWTGELWEIRHRCKRQLFGECPPLAAHRWCVGTGGVRR